MPVAKFTYSDEFKDLVFDMMAYNHKHRPSLEEIRNHPWIRMAQRRSQSDQDKQLQRENLKKQVIREMTRLKQSMLVKQINRNANEADDGSEETPEVVDQMPTTFWDFIRYQYNTRSSVQNFISK